MRAKALTGAKFEPQSTSRSCPFSAPPRTTLTFAHALSCFLLNTPHFNTSRFFADHNERYTFAYATHV